MKKIMKNGKTFLALIMTVFLALNSFFMCVYADGTGGTAGSERTGSREGNIPESGTLVVTNDGLYVDYAYGLGYMSYNEEEQPREPYTKQTDKWEVNNGILTLKDGFEFITSSTIALTFENVNNAYLELQGNVKIGYSYNDEGGIGINLRRGEMFISGEGTLDVFCQQNDNTYDLCRTAGIVSNKITVDLDGDSSINISGGDISGTAGYSVGILASEIKVKHGVVNATGGSTENVANNTSVGLLIHNSIDVFDGTINAYSKSENAGYGVFLGESCHVSENTYVTGAMNNETETNACLIQSLEDDVFGTGSVYTAQNTAAPLRYVRYEHEICNKILILEEGKLYCAEYDEEIGLNSVNNKTLYTGQRGLWETDTNGNLVLYAGFYYKTTAPIALYVKERQDNTATQINIFGRGEEMKLECGVPDDRGNICQCGTSVIYAEGDLKFGGTGNLTLQGPEKILGSNEAIPILSGIYCKKSLYVDIYLGKLAVSSGNMGEGSTGIGNGIYAEEGLVLSQGYIKAEGKTYGIVTKGIKYLTGQYIDGALDATGESMGVFFLNNGTITGDKTIVYGSSQFNEYNDIIPLNYEYGQLITSSSDEYGCARSVRILPEMSKMTLFYDASGMSLRVGITPTDYDFITIPYTEQTDLWRIRGNELQLNGGFTFETSAGISLFVTCNSTVRINSSTEGNPVRLTYTGNKDTSYGLYADRGVTIVGDGQLIIKGKDSNSSYSKALFSNNDVVVDLDQLGRIDCFAESQYGVGIDIYNGDLNVMFGTVYASGKVTGINADSLNITEGCVYATGEESSVILDSLISDTCMVTGSTGFNDFSDLRDVSAKEFNSWISVYYKYYIGEEETKSLYAEAVIQRQKEDRSLYFDSDSHKLLLKNSNGKLIPYTEQIDKWSIEEDGTLVLKDGFRFATIADNAVIIRGRNARIKLEGNSTIEQCSESLGNDYVQAVVRVSKSVTFTGDGTLDLIKTETATTYSSYAICCENNLNIQLEPAGKINAVVKDKCAGSGYAMAVQTGTLILSGGTLNAQAGKAGESYMSIGVLALYADGGLNITGGTLNAAGENYALGMRESCTFSDNMEFMGSTYSNTSDQMNEVNISGEKKVMWGDSEFYGFTLNDGTFVKSVRITAPQSVIPDNDVNNNAEQVEDAPATADTSAVFLWMLMILCSICTGVYAIISGTRKAR
ncbi:MAG: hypothetical protein ACI4D1_01685 [Lachnospira sp.]